jgi:hypothetical protein
LGKPIKSHFQEEALAFSGKIRPPAQFIAFTYYTSAKRCFMDSSLRMKMMEPDSINEYPIKTIFDSPKIEKNLRN